jgi:hypothetical protein
MVRYVDAPAGGEVTAGLVVYASRAQSRPSGGTDGAASVGTVYVDVVPRAVEATSQPAAGPDQIEHQKEGDMPLSELCSRLGLADDVDEAAVLAAVDDLLTKVATPAPELVAASAARDEMAKRVELLGEQLKTVTQQLSEVHAERAAAVKARVLDDAQRDGKFAPADREAWAKRYDDAPQVVTDVLASIATGTAVPVSPIGRSGSVEAATDAEDDAEFDRLFPPTPAATAAGGAR